MYSHALLQGIFPPQGLKPGLPEFNSLPPEPPKKPKNAEVGRLSLLQGNFWTQESNWGLLHCRRILYQLSLQGSPSTTLLLKYQHPNPHQFHHHSSLSAQQNLNIRKARMISSFFTALSLDFRIVPGTWCSKIVFVNSIK